MAAGALPCDWGFGETLAYASLVKEGYHVRLAGQDCGRGTFFHRHAVWHNQLKAQSHVPLRNLGDDVSGNFLVIDSLLSEEAVLAFEYGYASTDPETLVIWEAQFGDFANGAQVVIDQFISAAEQKWQRHAGITLLLPHGYEGQGPEHSSARLERFLQLCAQQNMQVCVPTTPAQVFHMLRRQMVRQSRLPLICMSPKSLLRHKMAVSQLEEFTDGKFNTVLADPESLHTTKGHRQLTLNQVNRAILCSGKVYYDLYQYREDQQLYDVTLIRLEQLYPFPSDELKHELQRYVNLDEVVWCQEEPRNQGAWYTIRHNLESVIKQEHVLYYAGRSASAAPAVGLASVHAHQQKDLVEQAFAKDFPY